MCTPTVQKLGFKSFQRQTFLRTQVPKLICQNPPENVWAALTLAERYEKTRRVFQELAGHQITLEPTDPGFVAQYAKALHRVGMVMNDEELENHVESLERAKRAGASAQATADALTNEAHDAETPEPVYDLSPAETQALLSRLEPAVLKLVRGTPTGDKVLASADGLKLTLGETSRGDALASYYAESNSIVLGENQLAGLLAAMGHTPRELLTNDEALADAAVLYSHLYVHEATHHRQEQWAQRIPEAARRIAYNQMSEVEANNAQAKFLKEKRAADPDFAARDARLRDVWGLVAAVMRQPEALAADPAAMASWLVEGYRHVPTLARSSARLIAFGLDVDQHGAGAARRVDAELARRGRRHEESDAQLAARRRRNDEGSDFKNLEIVDLRLMRDSLRGQAQAMMSVAAALAERFETELAKLKQ